MSAASLTPRVRLLALCDGVRESKLESGVFHLKGVRQHLVANLFPFAPSRLWLFLVLTSPRPGRFPGYVIVIHERTDKAVFYSHLEPVPTFESADEVWPNRAFIHCTFPEEGRYTVQLWFFQAQGRDVLKGELQFAVVSEGI